MTHKGWFWCCPIHLCMESPDQAAIEARHPWLEPLFTVCQWLEDARIWLSMRLIEDYEPTFMFSVTGELPSTRSTGA